MSIQRYQSSDGILELPFHHGYAVTVEIIGAPLHEVALWCTVLELVFSHFGHVSIQLHYSVF